MTIKNNISWNLSDIKNIPSNGVNVMSTFACGGGSSMGYKLAGCQVIAANDIDPEMCWHYKININPKYYFLCPIKELLTKTLPAELYSLDILDGSPPCSTFSMSGSREDSWGKNKHFREGQSTQVLSDLFFDYLDLVEKLKPKVAIAENVKGMILGNAKGYVKLVIERLKEIGYRPQFFLINAADCGVPQKRERVFFVALRNDIKADLLKIAPNQKHISCIQATKDLQLTQAEIQKVKFTAKTDIVWWPKTKPGESYSKARLKAGLNGSFFSHARLDGDKPANTLTAHDDLKHWSEARKLTFKEAVRLGTFPDDYKARNDKIGKYMIGMSVPPKMTEFIARAVVEQWIKPNKITA